MIAINILTQWVYYSPDEWSLLTGDNHTHLIPSETKANSWTGQHTSDKAAVHSSSVNFVSVDGFCASWGEDSSASSRDARRGSGTRRAHTRSAEMQGMSSGSRGGFPAVLWVAAEAAETSSALEGRNSPQSWRRSPMTCTALFGGSVLGGGLLLSAESGGESSPFSLQNLWMQ